MTARAKRYDGPMSRPARLVPLSLLALAACQRSPDAHAHALDGHADAGPPPCTPERHESPGLVVEKTRSCMTVVHADPAAYVPQLLTASERGGSRTASSWVARVQLGRGHQRRDVRRGRSRSHRPARGQRRARQQPARQPQARRVSGLRSDRSRRSAARLRQPRLPRLRSARAPQEVPFDRAELPAPRLQRPALAVEGRRAPQRRRHRRRRARLADLHPLAAADANRTDLARLLASPKPWRLLAAQCTSRAARKRRST